MLQCLLFRRAMSEALVDLQCRFSEEETAQLNRIVFAFGRASTDAPVHNPMMVRYLDEMLHNLRRQHYFAGVVDGLVHLDHLVFGEVDHVIALEQHVIHESSDHWCPSEPGDYVSVREASLQKLDM